MTFQEAGRFFREITQGKPLYLLVKRYLLMDGHTPIEIGRRRHTNRTIRSTSIATWSSQGLPGKMSRCSGVRCLNKHFLIFQFINS
jgi:hypothetical protein